MGKLTLDDVAREAGVSLATVDRVINGRTGVHARTAERVNATIKRLGFHSDPFASRLARTRDYDFHVILPSGENPFMAALGDALRATRDQVARERVSLTLHHVDTFDGHALADALDALPAGADGVAVVALDHPAVREAIDARVNAGVPVVTLVSDVPRSGRAHCVGIDNVAAGRTAASLIGRFSHRGAGTVGMIVGSLALRDHFERRSGFEQALKTEFPDLVMLPVRETRDEAEQVEEATRALLDAHPDLSAIYSAGSGHEGVIRSLEATGRGGDIIVVAHELTAVTRRHLVSGTVDAVINQDVGHMARSTARLLVALREGRPFVAGQERIRIDIFLKDNMP